MWYPQALPSFILPGIPAILQEMSPTCLRIFFKRHRSSDEAVFPNVWSKDHFHQMLTPFQIYQIGISMEWDPWIYSFNKHQRLFWRQWILRCTALTALTSPKEKVTQPLFLPRHLAEGSCWNGHLGSGRDMVTLGLQCKGHPACLGGRPLAGCCRAVRVPRTCGLEKCPEAINKHWKGWECTLNNEPCLLSMRTLASLG